MNAQKIKIKGRTGKWTAVEFAATDTHGPVALFENDSDEGYVENVVAKYNEDAEEWVEIASGYGDIDTILGDA